MINPTVTITMSPEAARWLLEFMSVRRREARGDASVWSAGLVTWSTHIIDQLEDELSPLNQPPGEQKPFPKFEE